MFSCRSATSPSPASDRPRHVAAIDYLLADGVAAQVTKLLSEAGPAAAPDLLGEPLATKDRALAAAAASRPPRERYMQVVGEWLARHD